jgi:hypothetical protein
MPQLSRTTYVKYADDVTLIHHIPRGKSDQLDVEWKAVLKWASEHDLEVNTKKTKVLTVHFSKNPPLMHILQGADNAVVEQVKSFKLLGLLFSDDLKWKIQVEAVSKRASRSIFLIRQLKHGGLPDAVLWNVYNALIRTLIAYASPATVNMPAVLRDKLMKIEKRVRGIIGADPPVPLSDFIHKNCLRLMKDIVCNDNHPLRTLFITNTTQRSLRRSHKLLSPFAKTNRLKDSFVKYALLDV